ncbi:MBL fold metallo-hydrolase [Sphingomonas sp. LB3N6]|uniref:MBL fold metallo-hydrolase n=1 Tax=Sphingomonas fucosidasi TaxID=3096164 RepID=UPI002FCA281F
MRNTLATICCLFLCAPSSAAPGATLQAPAAKSGDILVTLLGTGTPTLNPNRFGYSTLVQAGGLNLIFDAGRGNTIRLSQLGVKLGSIDATFITHFHSDHINGLGDLWTTSLLPSPQNDRKTPFQLYGPVGISQVASGMQTMFGPDLKIRRDDNEVTEQAEKLAVHEFTKDGVVFERNGVRVTAFTVDHGKSIKPAVGYRIDYNGHSVVLSGDTRYDREVIRQATGVDLLVHEVSIIAASHVNDVWARPSIAHHTSAEEAGDVFRTAKPKLAVFSHISRPGPQDATNTDAALKQRALSHWPNGNVVVGTDLMQIDVGSAVTIRPPVAK